MKEMKHRTWIKAEEEVQKKMRADGEEEGERRDTRGEIQEEKFKRRNTGGEKERREREKRGVKEREKRKERKREREREFAITTQLSLVRTGLLTIAHTQNDTEVAFYKIR